MNSMPRHAPVLSAAVVLLAAAGCEQAPPPQFHLNMVQMVASGLSDQSQHEIADVLAGLFGTPDEPFALPESGLNQLRLELSAGPAWSDRAGVDHGLYRRHCVHCHGISGDGRGPTARFLNPYPRDYRQGIFKFKSTYNPAKPTDDDLHRILNHGVPGTSMPSFSLLAQSQRESLIEYVKYLAIRGEMEQRLAAFVSSELGEVEAEDDQGNTVLDDDGNPVMEHLEFDPAGNQEHADIVKEELESVLAPWQEAAEQVVAPTEESIPEETRSPEEVAESIAAGRSLFMDPQKGNCASCHGPTALGDGQQTDFDIWSKESKAFVDRIAELEQSIEEEESAEEPDEQALAEYEAELAARQQVARALYPIRNAIPRNLRQGIYRGGRRRIDIFWRMHNGIAGSPMPGVGAASPGATGALTEEQMWNIVDYVLSLPYEPPSQPQPALPTNLEMIAN